MEMCVRTVVPVGFVRSKSGFWVVMFNDLYTNVQFLSIFHIWVCISLFHSYVGGCSKMPLVAGRL